VSITRVVPHAVGQCDKLAVLSDLEFRCWIQCLLSADDFGVLPLSSALLRDNNLALAASPAPMIDRALDVLVSLGLLVRFRYQGTAFGVSPFWQDVQRILLPRATSYPAPPATMIFQLSRATSRLFLAHHPSYRDDTARASRGIQSRSALVRTNHLPQHSRPLDARGRQPHTAHLRRSRRARR
jgi:hypothetical protein